MQVEKTSRRGRSQPCSLAVWSDSDAEHLVLAASSLSWAPSSLKSRGHGLLIQRGGRSGRATARRQTAFSAANICYVFGSLPPDLIRDESSFINGQATCHGESALAELWGWLSLARCRAAQQPFLAAGFCAWPHSGSLLSSSNLWRKSIKALWGMNSMTRLLFHQGERPVQHFQKTWDQVSSKLLHVKSEISHITPHAPKHLCT